MKALVYTENFLNRLAGDIEQIVKDSDMEKYQRHPLLAEGTLTIVDFPDDLDTAYIDTLKDEFDNWEIIEDTQRKADDELKRAMSELKIAMDAELYELMYSVVGTRDFNSALMFENTWRKMVEDPSDYSSLGLTARFERGGLNVGSPLDTDQKVLDYATECLTIAKAAEKTRMQRIEQYKQDAASLVASYSGSV